MGFDALLGIGAIDPFWRQQPTDVGRVVGLHFSQVASTVSTKGEHEFFTVFPDFTHAVNGRKIIQAPPQF